MECNGKIQTLLEALASALVKDSSGKVHLNLELLQWVFMSNKTHWAVHKYQQNDFKWIT